MAFLDTTKANIAYKLALGKIHTNNSRGPFNEPEGTQNITMGQYSWAEKFHPTNPTDSTNSGIVSSLLTLNLVAVSGTDATGIPSAYYCVLGSTVPTDLVGKINPRTGAVYAANDRIGNIIPMTAGAAYRPKLFKGVVETTPLDASDWFIDCFAGVVAQETDDTAAMINYSTGATVQAYIYIGKTVSDAISAASHSVVFYDKKSIGNGITGVIDGTNKFFVLDKAPNAGSEHVYLNGNLQSGFTSSDYTLTGNVIEFATAPFVGDQLVVSYRTGG